jgi:hypothetical protein
MTKCTTSGPSRIGLKAGVRSTRAPDPRSASWLSSGPEPKSALTVGMSVFEGEPATRIRRLDTRL